MRTYEEKRTYGSPKSAVPTRTIGLALIKFVLHQKWYRTRIRIRTKIIWEGSREVWRHTWNLQKWDVCLKQNNKKTKNSPHFFFYCNIEWKGGIFVFFSAKRKRLALNGLKELRYKNFLGGGQRFVTSFRTFCDEAWRWGGAEDGQKKHDVIYGQSLTYIKNFNIPCTASYRVEMASIIISLQQ